MNSDSTLLGRAAAPPPALGGETPGTMGAPPLSLTTAATATIPVVVALSDTARRVAAVIARRARAAGLTDANYFAEIIAGRAPRITRAEAASEPLPTPMTAARLGAGLDGAKTDADNAATTLH